MRLLTLLSSSASQSVVTRAMALLNASLLTHDFSAYGPPSLQAAAAIVVATRAGLAMGLSWPPELLLHITGHTQNQLEGSGCVAALAMLEARCARRRSEAEGGAPAGSRAGAQPVSHARSTPATGPTAPRKRKLEYTWEE